MYVESLTNKVRLFYTACGFVSLVSLVLMLYFYTTLQGPEMPNSASPRWLLRWNKLGRLSL
jgi:hypothetical protein